MKNKKDINYYKKLNYNVILKKMDSDYYLFIPELSLIVEGKSLDEVYERLETEKESYFKKAADMDALDIIKDPAPVVFRKKLFIDLAMFFTKALIIISICSAAFIGSLPFVNTFVTGRISRASANAAKALVTEFSYRVNYKLDNMSGEDRERARLKLRKVLQEIKPFINEVKVLLQDETPGGPKDRD